MPIYVFGNSFSSHGYGNKIDTSIIVPNLYLRTNYIESNIEEDLDLKNQHKKTSFYLYSQKNTMLSVNPMLILD